MADRKSGTAVGAKEAKKAESAGLIGTVLHAIGDIAEVAGGYLGIGNPLVGGPLILGGLAVNSVGDSADDVSAEHTAKGASEEALIAKARGGSAALGMRGVVPPSSLAGRVLQRFGGGQTQSSVSEARTEAGVQAADRAHHEQMTPATPAHSGPNRTEPHVAPNGVHHGWTDAARQASAQARGVHYNGPSR